jgi:hypothetical protein
MAGLAVSNPAEVLGCEGSCFCDELITRSEEFSRLCVSVSVCVLGTSTTWRSRLKLGCSAAGKKYEDMKQFHGV